MKITGIDQLNKKIGRMTEDFSKQAARQMELQGKSIYADTKANISDADLINYGKLIDSVYVTKPVKTPFGWEVEVGAKEKYAVYLHEGWDGQKMPPLENIRDWVQTKLGLTSEESYGVAWVIAENLRDNGRKAEPFLQMAIDENQPKIKKEVSKGLKAWFMRQFKKLKK